MHKAEEDYILKHRNQALFLFECCGLSCQLKIKKSTI